MSELTDWEWLILLSQWVLYISMSAAIGGAASQLLLRDRTALHHSLQRYTLLGALIGVLSLGLHFLIRVGALAESGVEGLLDPLMLQLMWQSSVGDALLWRVSGFGLLMVALLLGVGRRRWQWQLLIVELVLAVAGIGLIAISYSRTGHLVDQGLFAATLLAVHVVLTAWWMGSLYPLWLAGHQLPADQAHQALERFGEVAVLAVVVLLLAGGTLSYLLTGWSQLLSSTYGGWLLLKVALVGLILLLAAYHKFFLVPALAEHGDSKKLKRSIMLEKLVGAGIFAITTVLATLIGPGH